MQIHHFAKGDTKLMSVNVCMYSSQAALSSDYETASCMYVPLDLLFRCCSFCALDCVPLQLIAADPYLFDGLLFYFIFYSSLTKLNKGATVVPNMSALCLRT